MGVSHGRFRGLEGSDRRGTYDTPVTGSLLLGWRPNAKWEMATRFRASTGIPVTPYYASGPSAGTLDFTRYNDGGRLPNFAQVDVRIDRRWQPRGMQLIGYIDIQNLTGRDQVTRLQWNPRTRQAEYNTGLDSLIPSIGINWQF
jgi:hypothetical protein